jgi:hypothetical protein
MGGNFSENYKMTWEKHQLEKSLQRLGIRELEARLEVSPLVFGGQGVDSFQPDQGLFHCGAYKEDPLDLPEPIKPPIWVE